jgi:hypothetical protein
VTLRGERYFDYSCNAQIYEQAGSDTISKPIIT